MRCKKTVTKFKDKKFVSLILKRLISMFSGVGYVHHEVNNSNKNKNNEILINEPKICAN